MVETLSRKIIAIVVIATIVAHAVNRLLSATFNYMQYALGHRLGANPTTPITSPEALKKYGTEILTAIIEVFIVSIITVIIYMFTDIHKLGLADTERVAERAADGTTGTGVSAVTDAVLARFI